MKLAAAVAGYVLFVAIVLAVIIFAISPEPKEAVRHERMLK